MVCDSTGKVLAERRYDKGGSNNIAEFMAVHEALDWAERNKYTCVEIKTDSKTNFAWVAGEIDDSINDRTKVLLLRKAIDRLKGKVEFTLTWVPRKDNLAGALIDRQGSSND